MILALENGNKSNAPFHHESSDGYRKNEARPLVGVNALYSLHSVLRH